MKTADDRLVFAIDFAQKDLDRMRPGDWLNLKDDFEAFFLPPGQEATPQDLGGIMTTPVLDPLPQDFTEDNFRHLKKSTFKILASAANADVTENITVRRLNWHTETGAIIPTRAWKKEEFKPNILFQMVPLSLSDEGPTLPTFFGSTWDIFFLVLTLLLRQQPRDRIRRCPECQRLFLRMRKQAYCSRTCVNKVNKRAWRAAQEKKTQAPKRPGRKRKVA